MPRAIAIASRVEEARRGRGEDRIAVVEVSGRTVIVLADGAGGVAGGADAAEAICRAPADGDVWSSWLLERDAALAAERTGLAAAVVISIAADGDIRGASAGDCEAWIFGQGDPTCLTAGQVRKPLLGDGAEPVDLAARLVGGTLVVASDGLWKYATRARIAEGSAIRPLPSALTALVDAVRLPNGALQDDVAIVLCELVS